MAGPTQNLIDALMRRKGAHLPPGWAHDLPEHLSLADSDYPDIISATLGWKAPTPLRKRPKAQDFPLLAYVPDTGWCLAEQWQNETDLRLIGNDGIMVVGWDDDLQLVRLNIPAGAGQTHRGEAAAIFKDALRRRKRMLIDAGIATVVINLIALATSMFSMQVYDRVIPSGGFDTLWVLVAGMMFALIVDFVLRNARSLLIDREAGEIDAEVSEYFFARMQSVRLDSRPPGIGTTAAQMRGLDQIRSMMASATLFVLADLPFALLFMAVMGLLGGVVALVPIIVFPISLGLAVLFSRLIRDDTASSQVTGNQKNGLLVEALDASETIKANLGSWHMLAQWNRLVHRVHTSDLSVRRWSATATSTFGFLQQFAFVGIMVIGVYRITAGEMTMGGLIACSIISGRINGPLIGALPNLIIQWGYSRASLSALDRVLELPSDHPVDQRPVRLSEVKGTLQVENLQFGYPGTRNALAVPKLDIAKGEKIGVLGPVGSGKSTLIRLLAGLYAPQQGHVLLDGVDVRQIAEDSLRQHICYFPQDYRVISGTLRENLSLGVPDPRDEALLDAATKSGLIAMINQHPQGLDMRITEGGRGMSGGQRALVGLTRALLVRPSLMILDEPTANLDQESEVRVLNALAQHAGKDCTLIIVTHKPQLLRMFQRLLVINRGQLVLDGPTKLVIEALQKGATQNGGAPGASSAPAKAPATAPAHKPS